MPDPSRPTTCPTCSCETNGDHTCPHTKAPTPRELDARISKVLRAANDGIVAIRHDFETRCKGIEAKHADLDRRVEALYEPFDREATPADSTTDNGVRSTLTDDDLRLAIACWEAHRKSTGQVYVEFVTKSKRLEDGTLDQECLRISPRNILNELLNLRAANHEHTPRSEADVLTGGVSGVGGNTTDEATARCESGVGSERLTSPAASALPERPSWLEHYVAPRDMHVLTNGDRERLRDACRYALALESRLAEVVRDAEQNERARVNWRERFKQEAGEHADTQADRAALKAKLAEANEEILDWRSSAALALNGGRHDEMHCSCVGLILKANKDITTDRDALRAKLERLASMEAFDMPRAMDRKHDTELMLRIEYARSALAAAENTNTGDAGRTPAGAPVGNHAGTDEDPPHAAGRVVDEPGPVTNPAVSHPSPAPAFEMTAEQRLELARAACLIHDSDLAGKLYAYVETLVRTALRDSREGWVTREVASDAMWCWMNSCCEGSCGHGYSDAESCLSAAERDAASKGAGDGR